MAARIPSHDYCPNLTYSSTPYDDSDTRYESPLEPSYSNSPFDDHRYPYSHLTLTRSYSRASGRLMNPFGDGESIPLKDGQGHASSTTISPILPHETDDPLVRDIHPRKKRRRSKDGWFQGRITWVVYVLTAIQLVIFIAELIKNGILTSTPIEIKPSFNPMIGPSPYVLINMGARYQPCMHNMPNIQNSSTTISWPCPNATSTFGDSVSCSLSELCGFDGVPNPQPNGSLNDSPAPNQWWRFIVPIFIHAGFIHIAFNLLLQLTLGRDVEKLIGSIRFVLVYFASGIFGFVLGGNFAGTGIASCGCSGSLFGILAITLLDLFYTWKQRPGPIKDLLFILVDIIIAFILGLLPGLDNFSHIGGFLMGLVLGVCLLRSPAAISQRTNSLSDIKEDSALKEFSRQPLTFFQHRRGAWWAWWLVRVAALVGALVCFILLIENFYTGVTTCSWCKYLSCLPVTVNGVNWCAVGNLNFTTTNTTTGGGSGNVKRDLLFHSLGSAL